MSGRDFAVGQTFGSGRLRINKEQVGATHSGGSQRLSTKDDCPGNSNRHDRPRCLARSARARTSQSEAQELLLERHRLPFAMPGGRPTTSVAFHEYTLTLQAG
jgi:hypothetical protein